LTFLEKLLADLLPEGNSFQGGKDTGREKYSHYEHSFYGFGFYSYDGMTFGKDSENDPESSDALSAKARPD